jgi:hypothetical protein
MQTNYANSQASSLSDSSIARRTPMIPTNCVWVTDPNGSHRHVSCVPKPPPVGISNEPNGGDDSVDWARQMMTSRQIRTVETMEKRSEV